MFSHNSRHQSRIGKDPYDPAQATDFQRSFDTTKSSDPHDSTDNKGITNEACYVKHLYAKRSYLTVLVPSYDAMDGHGSSMNVLSSHLTKRLVWSVVRKEHGLSYPIHTTHFHSFLFPDYGYTVISIEVGPYNSKDSVNDPMNVKFSLTTLFKTLQSSRNYDAKLFEDSKQQLMAELKQEFADGGAWLALLRGMSLRVPVSMAKTHGKEGTLKDVQQGSDMLLFLQKTDRADFVAWTTKHGPMSDAVMLSANIETVDGPGVSVHANAVCNPLVL